MVVPKKKEIEMKRAAGSILYVLLSIFAAVTQTIDRYPYHYPSVNRFVSSKQNAYFIYEIKKITPWSRFRFVIASVKRDFLIKARRSVYNIGSAAI